MTSIYNKNHSVILSSNKDQRKIILKVEIETVSSGASNKELFIRLTDADSLSFLFCLRINDENFQELKNQQGLLVDLCAFGQKLIDLLELCRSEESSEYPKYILKLIGNGDLNNATLPGANWTLNFIETNPFKHLTHLSLRFCHGDTDQFKNYLIECLKTSRMENFNLSTQLQSTESSLLRKLQETEICLSDTKDQLHKLQLSSTSQLDNLKSKLENQIIKDKDKLIETETYYKSKHDQDRRDLESNFAMITRNCESKIQDLENTNKCLCDENSKLESDLRDLKLRHESLDESYKRSSQEIQNLRRCKEQCEKNIHELECQMQKMNTRIAVLEQEVRDKDQVLSRTQDLYTTELESKNRSSEDIMKKGRQIEKLEKAVKNLNEEVAKGNEIIQKLQSDIKHCHSKIKVRTQITAEQEKVLVERELELKRLMCDIDNAKKELCKKEDELQKTNLSLEQISKKLEEANHVIKTNENVINWLNRQVTEYELSKQKLGYSGLPPRSQQGTAFSTCTESTVKYRPTSAASNMSNGDHGSHSVLGGIVNRGKLLSGSNTSSISQTQIPFNTQHAINKMDAFAHPNSIPFSAAPDKMTVSYQPSGIEAKYLIKSSVPSNSSTSYINKFGQSQNPTMRNPTVSSAISIPEEPELNDSSHQQSLSSAYFPKPLLGPR